MSVVAGCRPGAVEARVQGMVDGGGGKNSIAVSIGAACSLRIGRLLDGEDAEAVDRIPSPASECIVDNTCIAKARRQGRRGVLDVAQDG